MKCHVMLRIYPILTFTFFRRVTRVYELHKRTSRILLEIESVLNLIVLNNCQCSLCLSNTRTKSGDPINPSRKGNRITSPPSVALNSSRVTNCLVCIRKFALVICSLREELSVLRCRMCYVYQC